MPLLFVCNKHKDIRGSLVSKANTFPRYKVYDHNGFPALKKEKAGNPIYGELWFVQDFDGLDTSGLSRELIFLETPCVFAYTYFKD